MLKKFRKKPIVIEAIQWDGCNLQEVMEGFPLISLKIGKNHYPQNISIETLEGKVRVSIGDWIVKGVSGEFYPVKPSIFKLTYEEVKE